MFDGTTTTEKVTMEKFWARYTLHKTRHVTYHDYLNNITHCQFARICFVEMPL